MIQIHHDTYGIQPFSVQTLTTNLIVVIEYIIHVPILLCVLVNV